MLANEYAGILWIEGHTVQTKAQVICGLSAGLTWITGEASWHVACPHYIFPLLKCQASALASVSSPWVGWRRTAPTPASVRWRGGRQSGSRWWPREEIVGLHRGGDDFLSQLPNIRVISSSVGGKGLSSGGSHMFSVVKVCDGAGLKGAEGVDTSITSEIGCFSDG